jgi:hypothetical protein
MYVGVRVCGCVGVWVCGCVGVWVRIQYIVCLCTFVYTYVYVRIYVCVWYAVHRQMRVTLATH